MPQNFGKMSDIYIPELIQLDSYWQKAVEDAVYDTLKGEKRLYYAMRNRKKINKKLEKLGLKPVYSRNSSSLVRRFISNPKKETSPQFGSKLAWETFGVTSNVSLASNTNEGDHDLEHAGSGSESRTLRNTPEKKKQHPDGSLLGDGSLEKMKKSQNTFNSEPMGMPENKLSAVLSESEDDDDDDLESRKTREEDNKNVKCLHSRDDSVFDDSDSEVFDVPAPKNNTKKKSNQLSLKVSRKNNMKKKKKMSFPVQKHNKKLKCSKGKNIKMPASDTLGDLYDDFGIKNILNEDGDSDNRLELALAKRDILKENQKNLRMGGSNNFIEIKKSEAKVSKGERRKKICLSPFARFYLEIYREYCHKWSSKKIYAEAAKRWSKMSDSEKAAYEKY